MSILTPIWAVLLLDSVLRFVLVCLRLLKPARRALPEAESGPNCLILIAARDEAGTIGPTVAALRRHLHEWPGSRIWVVADRCTDETAAEAEEAGAQVARRTAGPLGKGAVLAWWLQTHAQDWRPDDFILVLDADSRLSAGSLSALRNAVGKQAQQANVAQAFVAPHVPEGGATKSGRLAGWSEVLMQQIDDEARRRCEWSVPLRGTGMVFRAGLLAELAPRLHTLAEDLELDVLLAARGERVAFVPEATIFDPKPQQAAGASRQRARWLQGQLQVLRDYHWDCWRAFFNSGFGAVMLLSLLMLRPKTLFLGLRVLLLLSGLWQLALVGLLLDALYYLAGALLVEERGRYLRDLLAAPRYVLMWFFSFGMATVRRGWLRAGR